MAGMKVSVSLPEEDVAYIDDYAQRVGAPSRRSCTKPSRCSA
jgi:hypothetical protein